jgi:hypothetical protein
LDYLRPERPAEQFLWHAVRENDDENWVKVFEDAIFKEEEELQTANVHGLSDVDALYKRLEYVRVDSFISFCPELWSLRFRSSSGIVEMIAADQEAICPRVEIAKLVHCVWRPNVLKEEEREMANVKKGLIDADALYKRLAYARFFHSFPGLQLLRSKLSSRSFGNRCWESKCNLVACRIVKPLVLSVETCHFQRSRRASGRKREQNERR